MNKKIYIFLLLSFVPFYQIKSQVQVDRIIKTADSLAQKDITLGIEYVKQERKKHRGDSYISFKTAQYLGAKYSDMELYDSAIVYLLEEEKYALEKGDSLSLYYTTSDLGYIYIYKKEYQTAIKYYRQAVNYFKVSGSSTQEKNRSMKNLSVLLNSIGSLYIKKLQYDSALIYLYKALAIREKINAPERMIFANRYNIGVCYYSMNDYEKAIKLNQDLLEKAKESKDSVYMARAYSMLGIIYVDTKDSLKAIKMYQKSIAINKNLNNKRSLANNYVNLSDLLVNQNQFKEAEKYLKKSKQISKELEINTAFIDLAFAKLYFKTGEYAKCIKSAEKALDQARKSGSVNVEQKSLDYLYQSYFKQKNFHKAYNYLRESYTLLKTQSKKERMEYGEKLKEMFETEKKKKEIEFLKELNAKDQKTISLIRERQKLIVILFLAFIILSVLLYGYINTKRKKEKQIQQINRQLMENELALSHLKEEELRKEIQFKTRQLTTHSINMTKKNQLLQSLSEHFDTFINSCDGKSRDEALKLKRELKQGLNVENDWDLFKMYFEQLNKNFFEKLKSINPSLTNNDYRLCALIKLNMSIKEMASVMNISADSLKNARYRLKKKLHLENDESLPGFIRNL